MVLLEKLDAQKFYNCQFLAPTFLILAKTLLLIFSPLKIGKNGPAEGL